jgi:PAS domain S-box-containing protein
MKLTNQLLVIGAVNKVVKINGDPWCTSEEIQQLCGLNSKKVISLLENLIDDGFLEQYKNGYRQSIWISGHDKFIALIDNAKESLLVVQDFSVKLVNRAMIRTTVYSVEELKSKSFKEFIHRDDLMEVEKKHLCKDEGDFSCSFRFVDKDNSIRQAVGGRISSSDLAAWGGKPSKDDSHVHIVLIS